MKRRYFLLLGTLLGYASLLEAKHSRPLKQSMQEVEAVIGAVQEHLFPPHTKLPSAKKMGMTAFLFETMAHTSYDKDIKAFVIEGAKKLQQREKGFFLYYSTEEKEEALRAYEATRYGKNWLSRIMILSMEALFSDPIYGSNIKEKGWQALQTEGGFPRPEHRYIFG